jgi:hypothetical protein
LVVAPELAEVAERLGVPLHVGDRVRFKVIQEGLSDNGPAHRETWPPVWAGSIITDDERLAERVREVVRAAVQDPFGHQSRPLGLRLTSDHLRSSRRSATTVWLQPVHREFGDG